MLKYIEYNIDNVIQWNLLDVEGYAWWGLECICRVDNSPVSFTIFSMGNNLEIIKIKWHNYVILSVVSVASNIHWYIMFVCTVAVVSVWSNCSDINSTGGGDEAVHHFWCVYTVPGIAYMLCFYVFLLALESN